MSGEESAICSMVTLAVDLNELWVIHKRRLSRVADKRALILLYSVYLFRALAHLKRLRFHIQRLCHPSYERYKDFVIDYKLSVGGHYCFSFTRCVPRTFSLNQYDNIDVVP